MKRSETSEDGSPICGVRWRSCIQRRAALEYLFQAAEGSVLTEAGRKDFEAMKQLQAKAEELHKLAFGPDQPTPKPFIPATPPGSNGTGGFKGTGNPENEAKAREAAAKFAAAERELAQANDKLDADRAKAASEAKLAALEDLHKQELITDEDYYNQKAAAQTAANNAEQASIAKQKADAQAEIDKLQAQKFKGPNAASDAKNRDATVLERRAKMVDLDAQSAKYTAEQAKNVARAGQQSSGSGEEEERAG